MAGYWATVGVADADADEVDWSEVRRMKVCCVEVWCEVVCVCVCVLADWRRAHVKHHTQIDENSIKILIDRPAVMLKLRSTQNVLPDDRLLLAIEPPRHRRLGINKKAIQ